MDASSNPHFNLERYLTITCAAKPELFDWDAPQAPLDETALFALGYMMDIESHTPLYMRDLLATRVVRDFSITSFLSCWAYEELFHSILIKRLLGAQGVAIDDQRFAELRTRRRLRERMTRPLAMLISHFSRHFPAVHMTWGALNEISTLTGYTALIDYAAAAQGILPDADDSLLARVLRRIVKDERRHFAFYFTQARERLRSAPAQRLTSLLLRRFWQPVGSSVRGRNDAQRLCRSLFSNNEGRARLRQIDIVISQLPGLEWFDLASRRCAVG